MSLTFFLIWFAILVIDGVAVAGLSAIAASPRHARLLVRAGRNRMTPRAEATNTNLNNLFSMVIFGSYFYFLGAHTLYARTPNILVVVAQTLGVLLLYDLMYYFFHRAMHRPFLMRTVHGIHHQVRFPLARLSVYLHPLETLGGLGLLILAIVLLGPISATSFLLIFLIHSLANIIVHSNLHFNHPAMGLFNFWVAKHDVHHDKFKYNYASIFPFWDMAFGTSK